MSKYKYEQVIIRMKWTTYERIKSLFPAIEGESASSYFDRLAIFLRGLKK